MPRDLLKDLEICKKATPGPWVIAEEPEGSRFFSVIHGTAGVSFSGNRADNNFIAAAREGWPEAIERAIAAEELLVYVYPIVAGRVIQLQQAGEEKAAEQWNEVARKIYKAIEGRG